MLGKMAAVGILGLVALCGGCTLPCHPYDYCGPVYDGTGQNCSNARAGSILDGGAMQSLPASTEQTVNEKNASNPKKATPAVEEYEGATQILSVTDRKVDESENLAEPQSEADQSAPVLARPNSTNLRWK
jgi:hypothetical protein